MGEVEQVYGNLLRMLEYRKLRQTNKQLLKNELVHQMHHVEYILITAESLAPIDARKESLTIVLVAPGSRYATKSGDFVKLSAKVMPTEASKHVKPAVYTTIMFVTAESPSTHVRKKITKYKEQLTALCDKAGAPNTAGYEHHIYDIFLIEIPLHDSVPKHEIATDAEIADTCDYYRMIGERFPRISAKDPPVVWIGARVGQYVKVTRDSETAGHAIAYRLVIS